MRRRRRDEDDSEAVEEARAARSLFARLLTLGAPDPAHVERHRELLLGDYYTAALSTEQRDAHEAELDFIIAAGGHLPGVCGCVLCDPTIGAHRRRADVVSEFAAHRDRFTLPTQGA